MKRIGVVKVNGHSFFLGPLLNKFDKEKLQAESARTLEIMAQDEEPKIPLPGAKITQVWDADRERAERFASVFGVEAVADSLAAMIGKVDAVLVADASGDGGDHASLALPFLEAGIPTFVDKPFSNNLPDAQRMVEAAERAGAPLMSSSLLRFVKAVEEFRAEAETIGEVRHVVATGAGKTLIYGIHTCEPMLAISGGGVESVQNLGHEDLDLVFLKYSDGKTGVMQIFRNSPAAPHITLYGSKTVQSKQLSSLSYRYGAATMMQQFVTMIETRQPPIPYKDTLEILQILLATSLSLSQGRAIRLSELEHLSSAAL